MKYPRRAFTLVELLVVMVIIALLAGLVLAGAGYAQKKAARARAESEIKAMEAALEGYKADNGIYPVPFNQSDSSEIPKEAASRALYQALSGDGDDAIQGGDTSNKPDGAVDSGRKRYMEFTPDMLGGLDPTTRKVTANVYIRDPFGTSYGYYVPGPDGNPKVVNNPTFDLWSTGGTSQGSDTPKEWGKRWVTNW
jgi:prepilin-type N-terminal cleavage/methylation domain-containing protein